MLSEIFIDDALLFLWSPWPDKYFKSGDSFY